LHYINSFRFKKGSNLRRRAARETLPLEFGLNLFGAIVKKPQHEAEGHHQAPHQKEELAARSFVVGRYT
jgi:hypothetical protein